MIRIARLALPLLGILLAGISFTLAGQDDPARAIVVGIAAGLMVALGALAHQALLGAAVASAMGAGVSIYLTLSHHAAKSGVASACNINDTFNCDAVNTSAYSELMGIPIALLGLGFYVGVATFTFLAWQERERRAPAASLLLAAAIGACAYSGFLAWASVQIGAWCLFCISLYLTNAVLLAAGLVGVRDEGFLGPLGPALMGKGDRSITFALTAGLLALALGWVGLTPAVPTVTERAEGNLGLLYEQVDGRVELSGREPSWGKTDAPYVLVEFADYECPHCAEMAKEVKKLVSSHPELRVVFKHYPLSSSCNASIPTPFHENACMAAAAAVCAQEQGRFWELNDQMFANQAFLSKDNIFFMAQQLGLDEAGFNACMASPATAERVRADAADGAKAGVYSTPSIYLGNVVAPGEWVKVTMGAEAVSLMLGAAKAGQAFPPAGPPSPPPR